MNHVTFTLIDDTHLTSMDYIKEGYTELIAAPESYTHMSTCFVTVTIYIPNAIS